VCVRRSDELASPFLEPYRRCVVADLNEAHLIAMLAFERVPVGFRKSRADRGA
jgi:hypothetical protein